MQQVHSSFLDDFVTYFMAMLSAWKYQQNHQKQSTNAILQEYDAELQI